MLQVSKNRVFHSAEAHVCVSVCLSVVQLRSMTDLGLKEAKALVESAPCIIKKDVSKEDAEEMANKLKELGGTVVLE